MELKTKTQLLKEIESLKAQLEAEHASRLLADGRYEKEHSISNARKSIMETEMFYRKQTLDDNAKLRAENAELKEKLAAYENIDSFIKLIKSALKDDNAR